MTTIQFVGLVLIIGLVAASVLPLVAAGWSSRQEAKKLLAEGLDAEAEVLGYESVKGMWVQYRFLPQGFDKEIVCSKHLIHGGKRLPVGSRTPVKYKANFPSISLLVIYAESQAPS
ncbi:hypothetical protein [Methylibium sp.]|jgi:hypothetical protein|uniref:hypothetical protein n=1 Tax=Methylibium sp. TaxID=2067992 RepID=UPI003D0A8BA6